MHRTANVNEYSGRYSLMPMMFYEPEHEHLTTQSKSNRQGRTDNLLDEETYKSHMRTLSQQRQMAESNYKGMLQDEVARELARMDLPLSTYTFWYWKIDLHNLFHFLGLRCDSHAQWEIRAYANMMAGMAKKVAPLAFDAWVDYRFCGTNFSRQDILLLNHVMSWNDKFNPDNSDHIRSVEQAGKELEMSSREIQAFMGKMKPKDRPDFDLDISLAKEGSHFEEIIKSYSDESK